MENKYKKQVGSIIAKSLLEKTKNIRKLTKQEKENINYYGNKQINNEIRGVEILDNEKLLQIWNVDLKDTYDYIIKHKHIKGYNWKFRLIILESFKKQVKNELEKRKLI